MMKPGFTYQQEEWKRVPPTEMPESAELDLTTPFTEIEPLDMLDIGEKVGNIYKMVVILGRRADKINIERTIALEKEREKFPGDSNPLEDIEENPKHEVIAKKYEEMPKATLQAIYEYLRGELYYKEPRHPYMFDIPK